MKDILVIAFGAGLHDGLNPCIFITCAVFILHGLWLNLSSWRGFWFRLIFVLAYTSGFLFFYFGPGQILTLQNYFIFASQIIYLISGVWAFILGILFLRDWFFISRGKLVEGLADGKTKPFSGGVAAVLTTVILGLVLSALATIWPTNIYIFLLGNEAILRGQWQTVMPLLVGYTLMGMWPLWFAWALLSIKNLRPSLFKIICATIFFTASSSVILMFNGLSLYNIKVHHPKIIAAPAAHP